VDNTFKNFCNNLEGLLAAHESNQDPEEDLLVRQRKQLRNLIDLEAQFRDALVKHRWGVNVYRDFVTYIVEKRANILAARPFFRERSKVFTAHISKALKERNDKALYRFRINWSFVEWVVASRRWREGSKILDLANQISKQRIEIVEQNLPLAISQARQFWNATPPSHLSFMDIVQIQSQGMLLAVDKFVPPNDKRMSEKDSLARYRTFRAVAIGIMTRDRVNAYSETLLHFYPKDRLRMYAANKLLRRTSGEVDYEVLSENVNKNLQDAKVTTTPIEIQDLLAAGSTVSADYSPDPEGESVADSFADPTDTQENIETDQALGLMINKIAELDLLEQKLLRLKGIRS